MNRKPSIDPQALALMRSGHFAAALPLAERAVIGAVGCTVAHALLATLYLKLGRVREARDLIVESAALEDGEAEAYDGLAFTATDVGQHELARELYRRATQRAPNSPRHWHNLASSERSFGRLEAAEYACDRAVALDATQYPSLLLRSELRVQSRQENHIDDLTARLADATLDTTGRVFIGYALAKELDDVGEFDAAFRHFATAAALRRTQLRYDIAQDERSLERIAQVFDRRLDTALPHTAPQTTCDVFIIGLPRTGTTLLERILGGLDGVRSNGETENFAQALSMSAAGAAGDPWQRLANAPGATVAAHYHRLARVQPGEAVIDKLPTNYLYVGAILRSLPQAKILLLQRSPLDSCFAMFRSLFGGAYPFSYQFDELARYFAAYAKLTRHWQARHGDALHVVSYEELVKHPPAVGAAAARHCALAWRPEAVDIQRNRSVSLTASATQVRRPIYGTSSGRWRFYRAHLGPLIAALRARGIALPEDA